MNCSGCGQVDHAGPCDLVEFMQYQRYGTPAKRDDPSPPGERIDAKGGGYEGTTPLSGQTDILTLHVAHSILPAFATVHTDVITVKKASRGTKSKMKPADTPEMAAHREKVKQARIKRMAHARKVKAEKNATV